LLPHRPDTAGVLLLHGLAAISTTARGGLPVQLHVADADEFAPPAEVSTWLDAATRTGADGRFHLPARRPLLHRHQLARSPRTGDNPDPVTRTGLLADRLRLTLTHPVCVSNLVNMRGC
jgi:hypothetical protein